MYYGHMITYINYITRALRAHTLCTPCMSCIIVQLGLQYDVDDLYLHLTYEASFAHEQKAHA